MMSSIGKRPAGIVVVLLTAVGLFLAGSSSSSSGGKASGLGPGAVDFTRKSAKLWDDFAFWGREVILASKLSTPDAQNAVNRWNKAGADLAGLPGDYYGQSNGNLAATSLDGVQEDILHFTIASISNDTAGRNAANLALSQNADNLAGLLNALNPDNWPHDAVPKSLQNMIDDIKDYATAIIAAQWDRAAASFDAARDQQYLATF
jgi:hypothetical protein